MDMSFLIGSVKPTAKEKQDEKKLAPQPAPQPVSQPAPETPQPAPQAVNSRADAPKKAETEKIAEKAEKSVEAEKAEQVQKPTAQAPAKPQQKPQPKPQQKPQEQKQKQAQPKPQQKQTEDKLQERFLERLHKLGGEYFEYYSVYLLERYSRQNGRRLEALRISGGGQDGGIDGEIELTDKLGFRETIYIQAKNWDAEKGNKKLWIVGETLLQQFLGACAYRQAKDGKQNCRGIFITTSKFTPEARKMLDVMSDKIVGYDGTDLFETAKECGYGIVKKNGEWTLDEELLSGGNAFFRTF
jgi:restriction endonuclease Mrr